MNAPGDNSPQSGSYGSKEITEYLLSGLARITTPKPGVAALPFSCADGVVTAGAHRVAVAAILERTDPVHGKIAAGVRFEVTVDGSRVIPLTHSVLAVDESGQKACEQAVGDWYRAFGLCMFSGLAEAEPATTVSGWKVYAGFMGFRGSPPQGWLDGSAQMHDTILAALSMYLPSKDGEFHSLALMVVSNPNGRPNAKCELDAKDAPQAAAVLIPLPWPSSGSSYMFKQAYVLR